MRLLHPLGGLSLAVKPFWQVLFKGGRHIRSERDVSGLQNKTQHRGKRWVLVALPDHLAVAKDLAKDVVVNHRGERPDIKPGVGFVVRDEARVKVEVPAAFAHVGHAGLEGVERDAKVYQYGSAS